MGEHSMAQFLNAMLYNNKSLHLDAKCDEFHKNGPDQQQQGVRHKKTEGV